MTLLVTENINDLSFKCHSQEKCFYSNQSFFKFRTPTDPLVENTNLILSWISFFFQVPITPEEQNRVVFKLEIQRQGVTFRELQTCLSQGN